MPAREQTTFVADDRRVAFRLGHNEVVGKRGLRGGINFFGRGVESAELDVFENRVVKQKRVLGNEPDLRAQRFLGQAAHVVTVELECAGGRIVQA